METRRRYRDLISRLRWERMRLRRLTGNYAGWLPGDPLPAGVLDCRLATNEYGVYCIPRSASNRTVPRMVLRSRVYERETLDLMMQTAPAADIVHAGAFLGDFLPALACSRQEGALVWAFEPNRESYRCSMVTIFLNDLHNVVMANAGLDAGAGTHRLLIAGGTSRLIDDGPGQVNSEEVQLARIDDAVGADRRVGVIHLDIEGHEQRALAGAMDTIRRCLPLILVETVPEQQWLDEHLRPLGYELGGLVNCNRIIRPSAQAER